MSLAIRGAGVDQSTSMVEDPSLDDEPSSSNQQTLSKLGVSSTYYINMEVTTPFFTIDARPSRSLTPKGRRSLSSRTGRRFHPVKVDGRGSIA